jgi:hypothetical protein
VTVEDIARALDLIIARASALVAAGVRGRVTIGEVSFALVEPESEASVAAPALADEPGDALNDPATHGLFGDDAPARMPRRRREPLLSENGG